MTPTESSAYYRQQGVRLRELARLAGEPERQAELREMAMGFDRLAEFLDAKTET